MFFLAYLKPLPLALWFATLFIALPAWADSYERGLSAYSRLDYETARHEWSGSAIAGDPRAQFGLGMLHDFGQGVPEEPEAAVIWYRIAAEQGHSGAQLFLAYHYE